MSILPLKVVIYDIFIASFNNKLCNLWHSIRRTFTIAKMFKCRILSNDFAQTRNFIVWNESTFVFSAI